MIPVETIRLSQRGKEQLSTLKRHTGLKNWNVLCRWALCVSLAEESVPPNQDIPSDSSVEMTWKTFGGEYADVYAALVLERCKRDRLGVEPSVLADQFRLHVHRGISYLAGDRNNRTITGLLQRTQTRAGA